MSRPFPYLLVGCKPPRKRSRGLPAGYYAIRRALAELGLLRCLTCGRLQEPEAFYKTRSGTFSECKTCGVDRSVERKRRLRGRA